MDVLPATLRRLTLCTFLVFVASTAALGAPTRPTTTARSTSSTQAAAAASPDFARRLLSASGVSPARLDHDAARLAELAGELRATHDTAADVRQRAAAVHAFLHERILRGSYLASASDLGVALDGGSFNCAAASALFLTLARACGLETQVLSVRGHVWCRVLGVGEAIDVETTCRDWFAIARRNAGLPEARLSPAMVAHRRRVASGRVLSERQFRAIFAFNRGVTLLGQRQFAAAAWANLWALWLDPACRPAEENLRFALEHCSASAFLPFRPGEPAQPLAGA